MPDKEKVIKEWEAVLSRDPLDVPWDLIDDTLTLLKEQEAVKPVLEQDSMVCGNCGHEVIWQRLLGDDVWSDEHLEYCPHCGQAVKWE